MTISRLIAATAVAVFLLACVYVGYINEQLKGVIAPWHRAALIIGFIVGAGSVSRYVTNLAHRRRRARR